MHSPAVITPESLNTILDFDHVVRIGEDGTLQDVLFTDRPIYAPDLTVDDDGTYTLETDWNIREAGGEWALVHGKSGQYGYNGPLMHPSEYIGYDWAKEILTEPGYYVVIPTSGPNGEPGDEWALAFLPLETGDAARSATRPMTFRD